MYKSHGTLVEAIGFVLHALNWLSYYGEVEEAHTYHNSTIIAWLEKCCEPRLERTVQLMGFLVSHRVIGIMHFKTRIHPRNTVKSNFSCAPSYLHNFGGYVRALLNSSSTLHSNHFGWEGFYFSLNFYRRLFRKLARLFDKVILLLNGSLSDKSYFSGKPNSFRWAWWCW